jgi:ferritin
MTLEHEREVTAMIEELYREAESENDYATQVLLEWFIEEQVEEEKSVTEIVDHLKLVGDDGTGLLILDSRLAARTAEPAAGDTTE